MFDFENRPRCEIAYKLRVKASEVASAELPNVCNGFGESRMPHDAEAIRAAIIEGAGKCSLADIGGKMSEYHGNCPARSLAEQWDIQTDESQQ